MMNKINLLLIAFLLLSGCAKNKIKNVESYKSTNDHQMNELRKECRLEVFYQKSSSETITDLLNNQSLKEVISYNDQFSLEVVHGVYLNYLETLNKSSKSCTDKQQNIDQLDLILKENKCDKQVAFSMNFHAILNLYGKSQHMSYFNMMLTNKKKYECKNEINQQGSYKKLTNWIELGN